MSAVDWSEIGVGDLVLGADGNDWRVTARTAVGGVQLTREKDGREHVGTPSGAVERIATAAEISERAVAILQVRLGGEVVAERDEPRGGDPAPWRVPDTWVDTGALAAHLHLMHGEYTGWPDPGSRTAIEVQGHDGSKTKLTRAQLVEQHTTLHADLAAGRPPGGQYRPHVHVPNFYRKAD